MAGLVTSRPLFAPALVAALACVWIGAGGKVSPGEAVVPPLQAIPAQARPDRAQGPKAGFAGPFETLAVRAIDGDTFAARIRVWFGQEVETHVRLRGVDAPELAARCGQEAQAADAARALLAELLAAGAVTLTNVSGDKYFGRVVADATVVSREAAFPPTDIGAAMLAAGVARPYRGGARGAWCGSEMARR